MLKALDDFLLALRAEGCSPQTLRWYTEKLRHFVAAVDRPIAEITLQDIQAFLVSEQTRTYRYADHRYRPKTNNGLSPWVVRGYAKAIRRWFKWQVSEGRLGELENPARRLKLPKVPKQAPKGISLDDLRRLLAAARSRPRDYALLLMLLDTGCRVGELCGLKFGDVDLEAGLATVMGKGRKERRVAFGKLTTKAVREWLAARPDDPESEVIFTGRRGPLTPAGVAVVLRKLKKAAGVKGRCNAHAFRHAFAREYLLDGGDMGSLADLLGHSDIGVTKQFYTIFTESELKAKHDRHSPVNKLTQAQD